MNSPSEKDQLLDRSFAIYQYGIYPKSTYVQKKSMQFLPDNTNTSTGILDSPDLRLPISSSRQLIDSDFLINEEGIDGEAEEIIQRIYEENTPPKVLLRVHGYYHKKTNHQVPVPSADSSAIKYNPQSVDKFQIEYDLTNWMQCLGFCTEIDPKTGQVKSLQERVSEYLEGKSPLKPLQLEKTIRCNLDLLKNTVSRSLRDHGYGEEVVISYEVNKDQVTIVAPESFLSEGCQIGIYSNLCLMSLIFAFAKREQAIALRLVIASVFVTLCTFFTVCAKPDLCTLKSVWTMTVSEEDWVRYHLPDIIAQIPGNQSHDDEPADYSLQEK